MYFIFHSYSCTLKLIVLFSYFIGCSKYKTDIVRQLPNDKFIYNQPCGSPRELQFSRSGFQFCSNGVVIIDMQMRYLITSLQVAGEKDSMEATIKFHLSYLEPTKSEWKFFMSNENEKYVRKFFFNRRKIFTFFILM